MSETKKIVSGPTLIWNKGGIRLSGEARGHSWWHGYTEDRKYEWYCVGVTGAQSTARVNWIIGGKLQYTAEAPGGKLLGSYDLNNPNSLNDAKSACQMHANEQPQFVGSEPLPYYDDVRDNHDHGYEWLDN